MSKDTVIKVEGMYKKFCRSLRRSMAYGSIDLARNFIGLPSDDGVLRKSEFWALEDINFELKHGETLGIIGINGSGKSTLLRLLSGIFPPDRGRIEVNGKIGALIAVGAGFHPHMTGRENIYLNGTILGMQRSQIEKNFSDIIDFADIGEFLDAPVSTYSSGMRVRLGFSIAIHSNPEILLIDEILSVGDLSFRNKSLRKLHELRDSVKGVLFVSHDMDQVLNVSDKILLLDKGKVLAYGDPEEIVLSYYKLTNEIKYETMRKELLKNVGIGLGQHVSSGEVELIDVGLEDETGKKIHEIGYGEDLNLFYVFETKKLISRPSFSAVIRDDRNFDIVWQINLDKKIYFDNLAPGKYKLKVKLKNPNLEPNNIFRVIFGMKDAKTLEYFEKFAMKGQNVFKVNGDRIPRGTISLESEWNLETIK